MTPRGWKTPPGLARKITSYAEEHAPCEDCGAASGDLCTEPGVGRTVHGTRWVTAAIAIKAEQAAARRTPEQDAILARLPRIPPEEIEKCRTPRGGYSFTRQWFIEHGLPHPPIAGWRQAVEREGDVT